VLTFAQYLKEFSAADLLTPPKKKSIYKSLGLAKPKPIKKKKSKSKKKIDFKVKKIPKISTIARRALKQALTPKPPV
jgi:hypothetical protein